MKSTLKLEEAAMAALAIYALTIYNLGLPVWLWILLFFTPDIGMIGYLFNTRIGACTYNIFHHKGIALVIATAGFIVQNDIALATGILLLAHASFDRIWGYGLKFEDNFKHTHLGNL